jgi:hypothetical protein
VQVAEGGDQGGGEGGRVDVMGHSHETTCRRLTHRPLQRRKERSASRGIVEWLTIRIKSRDTTLRQQEATGASIWLSRSPIQRPIRAFSSTVVRISVTCGLCS